MIAVIALAVDSCWPLRIFWMDKSAVHDTETAKIWHLRSDVYRCPENICTVLRGICAVPRCIFNVILHMVSE